MPKAAKIGITGRVQGVGFRIHTQRVALSLGLAGWVRNRADGSVEAFVQGEEDQIQALVAWCRQGSPASRVQDVVTLVAEVQSELCSFEILPDGP